GFDEINLNVGCPSDRVQSGCFGAVLMERPGLVAECVAAMAEAAGRNGPTITVKCRIGVDEQDPRDALPRLLAAVQGAGVGRVIVHARKAWLQGLSPKENREIPPLDHELVYEMAAAFPGLAICLNGGVTSLAQAQALLARGGIAGVMVGRAAYHDPGAVLLGADSALWGAPDPVATMPEAVAAMRPHIARHLEGGGRLSQVTRHMLGLFAGWPGARGWRRVLSEGSTRPGATLEVLDAALAHVLPGAQPGRDMTREAALAPARASG
ncbi:MAG: tRNA dihydrouridine(20/20a) synthase DusA, partial [Rhodobacteraceae bacterium]|nr:tRNA dihydrouridine(20/20a) synthase DusA [Paracoccaceae bacterium]